MLRALLATSLLMTAPVAAQVTVYSNFGPGGTYDVSGSVIATFAVAPWFTYTGPSGGSLYDIQLAMHEIRGGTLEVGFYLGQPGSTLTLLEAWSVPETTAGNTFSLTSILTPHLSTGMVYSLWLSVPEPGGMWVWNEALAPVSGAGYTDDDGATWNVQPQSPQGAFAVSIAGDDTIPGEVVPEPATLTLVATGTAALLATRRRRRA